MVVVAAQASRPASGAVGGVEAAQASARASGRGDEVAGAQASPLPVPLGLEEEAEAEQALSLQSAAVEAVADWSAARRLEPQREAGCEQAARSA